MSRRVTAGYSLVELLVSTGMVLTLSAVSLPVISSSLEQHRLQDGARLVIAQAQSARFQAIATNASHRLHLNGNSLEIQRLIDGEFTLVGSALFSPSIAVAMAWESAPVFSPRGTVSAAAAISLQNRRGEVRTVHISVLGHPTSLLAQGEL